jgi:hypothetical protein
MFVSSFRVDRSKRLWIKYERRREDNKATNPNDMRSPSIAQQSSGMPTIFVTFLVNAAYSGL